MRTSNADLRLVLNRKAKGYLQGWNMEESLTLIDEAQTALYKDSVRTAL